MWLKSTECGCQIELSNFIRFSFLIDLRLRNVAVALCESRATFWKWISHSRFFFCLFFSCFSSLRTNRIGSNRIEKWVDWSRCITVGTSFSISVLIIDHNSKIRFLFSPPGRMKLMTRHKFTNMIMYLKKWFKLMFPLLPIPWNTLGIANCWLQNPYFFFSFVSSFFFTWFFRCVLCWAKNGFHFSLLWLMEPCNPVVHFGHIYRFNFQLSFDGDGAHVIFFSLQMDGTYFMIDKFSIKTLEFRNKFRKSYVNVR